MDARLRGMNAPRRPLLGAAILGLGALAAIAQEMGRTADVTVSLDVPAQVGVLADGEFTFDLARLAGAGQGSAPCVDRFPPPFDCPVAYFHPTSTFFRAAAQGAAAPSPGTVFLQIVDNLPGGTVHLRHSISAEWSGGNPGIPTTSIETASIGPGGQVGDFRPLPTAPEELLTLSAPTAPVRSDRAIRLALPRGARIGATSQPVTATITYDVFHTPS